MAYNSSYTGPEIDSAIGAVKNKEKTWDSKQNKLNGTEDQLVGFNSAGDAVAVAAPDPLPTGGEEGQVLTKTASGAQWDDIPSDLPSGGTDGQILTKTADGVAWEDAPEAGVTSFKGRTGAVTPQEGDYTADMVGARPDTWTPSAADVGAIPNPSGGTTGQILEKTETGTQWADNPGMTQAAADARYLQLSGGTMTGALVLPGEPTSANQAANKAYVDNAVPSVITVSTNTTVATSAWSSNSTYSAYPYRASVAVANVTANHFPSIVFNPNDADFSKLAPVCETYAGGIYIYASEIPSATVNILSMMFTAQS